MIARIAAVGIVVIAVGVVAYLLLANGGGTTYKLKLMTSGQLVTGDEVWIGGQPVGSVDGLKLQSDNQVEVDITLEDEYAPLYEGTTAVVRAQGLSGVANRYVAIQPGPNIDGADELEEGQVITADKTKSIVEIDQFFDMFGPQTRRGLAAFVQGLSQAVTGCDRRTNTSNPEDCSGAAGAESARRVNQAALYLNPAISTTTRLVNEVTTDERSLVNLIVNTASVSTAVAERRSDLEGLISNTNTTLGAIGDESDSLTATLNLLPFTLRRANTTFVNLRATLDDLTVLVDESKPATRDLAPFLAELRPLVDDARPTIRDLRLLIRTPGADNDLIDLLRLLPDLQEIASPTFRNTVRALQKTQPVIDFIRPYTPEIEGWFRDFGQGAAYYDANGHYARIGPYFGAFTSNPGAAGNFVLSPRTPGSGRLEGLQDFDERCPGQSTQIRPDNSNNPNNSFFNNIDCDRSEIAPGQFP